MRQNTQKMGNICEHGKTCNYFTCVPWGNLTEAGETLATTQGSSNGCLLPGLKGLC